MPSSKATQLPQPRDQQLPDSHSLGPVPGDPMPVNALPTSAAVTPDGQWIAFIHTGYGYEKNGKQQGITIVSTATAQTTEYNEPRLKQKAHQTFSFGSAWSSDGKHLYVPFGSSTDPLGARSGDTGNGIGVYAFTARSGAPQLELEKIIPMPVAELGAGKRPLPINGSIGAQRQVTFPAGLARFTSGGSEKLLVAEQLSDTASIVDVNSGKVDARVELGEGAWVPSAYPYAVAVDRAGRRGFITLWNTSEVVEVDLTRARITRRFALRRPKEPTASGSHPAALALSNDGRYLFCALANTDEVASIALSSGAIRFVSTAPSRQQYHGGVPNALALSADGMALYVANASTDSVAVFSVSAGALKLRGFIPTEWYPTALAFAHGQLFIGSGKAERPGPNGGRSRPDKPYIAALVHGSIAHLPSALLAAGLATWTQQVLRGNHFDAAPRKIAFAGGANPIKHVIYVEKENRTYDQVFGDIPEGNGDPSIVMYGAEVTPNQHALARQFGLLDNFYDSGEVSGNGHVWSAAATSSDYTERIWPMNYRGKERPYDFEGLVSHRIAWRDGYADIDEPGTGYIWANLARHNKTHRQYGDFVDNVWCGKEENEGTTGESGPELDRAACPLKWVDPGQPFPPTMSVHAGEANPFPWAIPMLYRLQATKPELEGHSDLHYPGFNTEYPDQLRIDEFLREFAQFVDARTSGSGTPLPDYVFVYLPSDHTAGARANYPTPRAMVADNDLAVGRLVEAVSHSLYWDDTAILVLEDDAQNGQDHVDAHRSTALVISKYSPRAAGGGIFVDSGFYTTVNMVRTIEDLLGLPPMNANDGWAPPIARLFSGAGDQQPFTADRRNLENRMIYEVNPAKTKEAAASSKLDLSRPDAADAEVLNGILWRLAKGARPMPKPQHRIMRGDD